MEENRWTVEKADAYLNAIPKFTTEKHTAAGLRRMLSFLGAMPQKEAILHIAGTNGKGSVCSFLDAILQKAGKRTARFTSPHLVRVTERFSFDGQEAEDELFLEAFEAVRTAYVHFEEEGLGHPTYFEYLFLMFMWMVRQKNPEYVILETGLGGRLDATNCFEHPALTVITSISLDHMEYLGDTVSRIAGEKAGILKEGVPAVYDDTDAAASAVIKARAEELSCPAYPIGPSFYTDLCRENGGLSLDVHPDSIRGLDSQHLFIPFEAEYQAVNACLAYQSACLLAIDPETAAAGIRSAVWRGRMEEVRTGIYLDGAHNEGGIRAFASDAAAIVKERKKSSSQGRTFLLFAAVSDKNYESMLETLMQKLKPDQLILTHLATGRALSLEAMEAAARRAETHVCGKTDSGPDLEAEAGQAEQNCKHERGKQRGAEEKQRETYQCEISSMPDVRAAFQKMLQEKRPEDTCFCGGSLYLVGELEAVLG